MGKLIRTLSLVVLILSGLAFCVIPWLQIKAYPYMIVPAVGFTGIYVWVLLVELWGALTGYKKTLSTRWKHWAEKEPFLSWSALALFWVAMSALVLHLGVYW